MNPYLNFIENNFLFPTNKDYSEYREVNHKCLDCKKNNSKYECQICNHFWCQEHSCQHLKKPSNQIINIIGNCPICFTGYSLQSSYKLEPCNHLFHFECIRKWLFLNDDCPYCRTEVENNPYKCEEEEFKKYQAEYLEFIMEYLNF